MRPTFSSTGRGRWLYLVTPVASVVVGLVIAEICFLIAYPIPSLRTPAVLFDPDSATGYRPRPHSTGYFEKEIPVRINANGHRDEPATVRKAEGAFRVLVLGDSFTFGVKVAQENVYPEVLEELLREATTAPLEVINAGVGGWEPFQYAQYYEYYGFKFSPDLILVGFFVGNDTYHQAATTNELPTVVEGKRVSPDAATAFFFDLKIFLYDHLSIARFILNRGRMPGEFERTDCSDFTDFYLRVQRSRLYNHEARTTDIEQKGRNGFTHILRIKKLADRDGIPFGVVLIPDENQINENLQQRLLPNGQTGDLDFDMPQSMLNEWFSGAGIPVVDLLARFREDSRCLYLNDTHWTAEGHELAATAIFETITDPARWPQAASRLHSLQAQ